MTFTHGAADTLTTATQAFAPIAANQNKFDNTGHRSLQTTVLSQRKAPATCGELLQGSINGNDFLVNCPIDLYSHAFVRSNHSNDFTFDQADQFRKVQAAIELISDYAQRLHHPAPESAYADAIGHALILTSNIPRGKGMASSSADLAAALTSVCDARNLWIPVKELSRLIACIEPSDGVHLPGIAHVNHLTGHVHECLPAPSDLSVIVVDCGGEIDTVTFDREKARHLYRNEESKIAAALGMLKKGLQQRDLIAIANAATISSEMSQQVLPKAPFEELLYHVKELGALGVNCAHSGTVLGVLHRTSDQITDKLVEAIEHRFGASINILGCHSIISGGCHVN